MELTFFLIAILLAFYGLFMAADDDALFTLTGVTHGPNR